MPRYAITRPDDIQYDWLIGDGPLEALHRLHREALGADRVRLEGDRLVFQDPADQALCAGAWRVSTCGPNRMAVEITIAPPVPVPAAA